jgi:hypothetical protein
MERTVPSTASDEIELYLRTMYSLLRSTTEVQIRTLEEVHAGVHSLLHPDARKDTPDLSAFIYSMLRLPDEISEVRSVILGQSLEVFTQHGFECVDCWEVVTARARRRRMYYDGEGTLACLIASRSDIEDILPTLVAYQIEWNKLNALLKRRLPGVDFSMPASTPDFQTNLADSLGLTREDLDRLHSLWGEKFGNHLNLIASRPLSLGVRLLSGSLSEYRRATHAWWNHIVEQFPQVTRQPVYFVSSNTHSIINLLTGFALARKTEILRYLEELGDTGLQAEWEAVQEYGAGQENFLYYLMKKAQQGSGGDSLLVSQHEVEQNSGIFRLPAENYFDVEAQVVHLNRLDPLSMDPRLGYTDLAFLKRSDALIVNIDYPLGLAAYNILSKLAEQVSPVLGVYMMGKAATLNTAIGDIMIPNVVHDEQSLNTYLFQNAFTAADVSPHLVFGAVLDNQKAVSVAGTFLQNASFMDVFYREGYTDIEMEAGPYLSAVYEMYRPRRHPVNEIVNLYGAPFEIGMLHYASDTPLSKGKNLGAGTLSYYGMDSTYAASVAILRRIFEIEHRRLGG